MSEISTPQPQLLEAFWVRAITVARLNQAEAFMSQDDLLSLRPAAFAFGNTKEMADQLCALVLNGEKKATTSYGPAYLVESVAYPQVGDLGILCDGSGYPRALLRTAKVEVFSFQEVPDHVAQLEGEYRHAKDPAEAAALWRADHEEFFRKDFALIGGDFDPADDVIIEHFEVLYQVKP